MKRSQVWMVVVVAVMTAILPSLALGQEFYSPKPTATVGPQKVSGGPIDVLVDGLSEADINQMDQGQLQLLLGTERELANIGLGVNTDPNLQSAWRVELFRVAEGGTMFAAAGSIRNFDLATAAERGDLVVEARATLYGQVKWAETITGSQQLASENIISFSRDNRRNGSNTSLTDNRRSSRSGRSGGLGGYNSRTNTSLTDRNSGLGGRSGRGGGGMGYNSHSNTSLTDRAGYSSRGRGIGSGYRIGSNGRGAQIYWATAPANTAVQSICTKVAKHLKAAILAANSR